MSEFVKTARKLPTGVPLQQPAGAETKRKANNVGRPKAGTVTIDAQDAIMNAALPLFAEQNFSAVSTKDIASAAGLNTALIYYYFGSKEELYRRSVLLAVAQASQRFQDLTGRELSGVDLVHRWIDCHETEFDSVAQLLRMSMGYAATPDRHRSVDEAIEGFHRETREILRSALRDCTRDSDRNIDVEQTVTFIATYLDGVYVRATIFSDLDHRAEIAELRTFLQARLGGQT